MISYRLDLSAWQAHMATFGVAPEGSSVPLARFLRLYDVLNGLAIEADRIPPGR